VPLSHHDPFRVARAAQALKQVKGVLNKLTPEKFEQLLQQLLDAVKSVVVLRGLITLIFENAVAQVRPLLPHYFAAIVHSVATAWGNIQAWARVRQSSLHSVDASQLAEHREQVP